MDQCARDEKQLQYAIGLLAGYKNALMLTIGDVFQPEPTASDRRVSDKVDPDFVRTGSYDPRDGAATESAQWCGTGTFSIQYLLKQIDDNLPSDVKLAFFPSSRLMIIYQVKWH